MHPAEETLLAFATGEADLPHRVLLEGHLDTCAECRETVREMRRPGGVLLGSSPAAPVSESLWTRLKEQVAKIPPSAELAKPSPLARYPIPPSALAEIPIDREPRWRWLGAPGARGTVLWRDPGTGSYLLLGRMKPEHHFPRHRHPGWEDLLVLSGGYEDQFGHFDAGEYMAYAPGSEHRPYILPGDECWVLTRLEKPVEFLGWRGWAQKMFS